MAKRWTGRRVIGAAIALVIVGAIGGTIAMRIVKKINDAPGGKSPEVVVLDAGHATGELRTDVTAEDIAASLIGVFTVAQPPTHHARADRLLNILMNGLRSAH